MLDNVNPQPLYQIIILHTPELCMRNLSLNWKISYNDFPKSGTYIYLILLLKTQIEVSYYDFPKSGTYIYLILLLKTPLGHFIYSLRELGSRFARTLSLHSKQIWIFFFHIRKKLNNQARCGTNQFFTNKGLIVSI